MGSFHVEVGAWFPWSRHIYIYILSRVSWRGPSDSFPISACWAFRASESMYMYCTTIRNDFFGGKMHVEWWHDLWKPAEVETVACLGVRPGLLFKMILCNLKGNPTHHTTPLRTPSSNPNVFMATLRKRHHLEDQFSACSLTPNPSHVFIVFRCH